MTAKPTKPGITTFTAAQSLQSFNSQMRLADKARRGEPMQPFEQDGSKTYQQDLPTRSSRASRRKA